MTQPGVKKNPTLHLLLIVPSCKAMLIFISIEKCSVSENVGAVCWGPSWKIPQVQSRVSSCNWILKFTSARTNCAGWKRVVPSPNTKPPQHRAAGLNRERSMLRSWRFLLLQAKTQFLFQAFATLLGLTFCYLIFVLTSSHLLNPHAHLGCS